MERDRHYPGLHFGRRLNRGELLVTGHGHIVVKEPIRLSRALLVRSKEVVRVEFAPRDQSCVPCNPTLPDELDWDIVEEHEHKQRHPIAFLRITWHVHSARTILWEIFDVE